MLKKQLLKSRKKRLKTAASSRSILSRKFTEITENTCSQLPRTQVISKNIQRCRQKQSGFPANPVARHGFEIPYKYGKLDNGEQFLRYDSGIEDHQRILIFASERALEDIATYCHWACDGTFKIVPEQWYQLFCIHVQVNGSSFPRVFALLPNKTKQTYQSFFEQLKIMQPNVDPVDLMADFEVAIHKSFNSSFPNSSIAACLFHLGQSIFRKIVDLGLKEKCNKHSEFCLKIRCFSALAFLPTEDVGEAYEELIDDDEIPSELITYFDVTFMGVVRGRGARRRRDSPIFPIDVWNVNERILQDLPRTNNAAEGFHSAIKRSAGGAHLNIWKFIKTLKEEEGFIQGRLTQILRGDPSNSCSRYKKITDRLKRLVTGYESTRKAEFLKNVAYNLHQF
ncbi:uncharacterized protein [Palaemon carinicauda]|uniref:uncharacterized protein n=1 Tax=Palaemon carinicauda TaxID=392227 RepID=UPI0035B5D9A1